MEINKIYNEDCIDGMKEHIPDESVDLIIADPPYYKVVNESWDNAWRTMEDYVAWSKEWITQAARALRKGGSFYLFGYFRTLGHLIPVLEEAGLEVRQQIIINKGTRPIARRNTEQYKMFATVTESILFLYKDQKYFVRDFLRERQKQLGLTSKEINEKLDTKTTGGGLWSIYAGTNCMGRTPTKQMWEKLQKILDFDYPYSKLEQVFHPQKGLTNVWDDIDFYEEDRIHPTQKPQKVMERIIEASSDAGDIILDPFMGSGSTAIACLNNNRKYIGFELDEEYYKASVERVMRHKEAIDAFRRKSRETQKVN